jgi:hypothetical protein
LQSAIDDFSKTVKKAFKSWYDYDSDPVPRQKEITKSIRTVNHVLRRPRLMGADVGALKEEIWLLKRAVKKMITKSA